MPQPVQVRQLVILVLAKREGAFKLQTGLTFVEPNDYGLVSNAIANHDQEQSAGKGDTNRHCDAGSSLRDVSNRAGEWVLSV